MQKLMIMPLQMYNGTKRELLITTSLLVKVPFCAEDMGHIRHARLCLHIYISRPCKPGRSLFPLGNKRTYEGIGSYDQPYLFGQRSNLVF